MMTSSGIKVTQVESWEEFETKLKEFSSSACKTKPQYSNSPLIYRGLSDSSFNLSTTLERATSTTEYSVSAYYKLISRVKPQIEAFTDNQWYLKTYPEFEKAVKNFEEFRDQRFDIETYSYLIHLRHHGFPSPFLDWSRSHYVAAYFAFRSPEPPESEKVSIYAFVELPEGYKITSDDEPIIIGFGPYVTAHRRHFLQQAEYTIAAKFKDSRWYFVPHDEVWALNKDYQDLCVRFDIPWSERLKVLRSLDSYNLNAHSLFNSEETLMETMALRELVFKC